MNLEETNYFLGWLAQADPRVMNGIAAVEVWQAALIHATPAEAKQAVLDHTLANDGPATPAAIRKRAAQLRITAEAQTRALTAAPSPVKNPNSFRSRNPELWDKLFEEGRQARRDDLAARGLL